jgi:hypothetical protein
LELGCRILQSDLKYPKELLALETFAEPRGLVENRRFSAQREKVLEEIQAVSIDAPIMAMVHRFNALPCAFTLQSCYGHFMWPGQEDPQNLDALPVDKGLDRVEYRIAYLAFCVENSAKGRSLLEALRGVTTIDPENVQFGSPGWFWHRQLNSYALQVEPARFKHQDEAELPYDEALLIEKIRNRFFKQIEMLVSK